MAIAPLGMIGLVEPLRDDELELALQRRLVAEEQQAAVGIGAGGRPGR